MKRFFAMILVFVAALVLVGCGEKEFKTDGEFTAFEVGTTYDGAPQVTSVTVTIEKGKIAKFYIDCRQGKVTKDANNKVTAVAWNTKTKKELKEDYGMKDVSAIGKEWYEQAKALEDHFLANGTNLTVDKEGFIQGVAGVSIKDGGYSRLAKKAVDNAKASKFVVFEHGAKYDGTSAITWVELVVEKKKAKSIFIDCRQSTLKADGSGLAWNVKTKKELKFDYNMKPVSEIGKEWFEQAEAIEAQILANGPNSVTVNTDGYITGLAGVSIIDGGYTKLAKAAYKAAGLDASASKK